MAAIADITVKLANGTTDYVLTAKQGAGPDGTAALWRYDGGSVLDSERLTAQVSTRWNDKRTARVTQCLVRLPILRATAVAGVNDIVGYAECRDGRFTIPSNMTSQQQMDFTAIAVNFMASALIKGTISGGYAPN